MAFHIGLLALGTLVPVPELARDSSAVGADRIGCSAAGYGTGLQFFLLAMVLWGLLRRGRTQQGERRKRRHRGPLGVALVVGGLLWSSSAALASSSSITPRGPIETYIGGCSTGGCSQHFGAALSEDRGLLLVGAPHAPPRVGDGENAGSAYVLAPIGSYWRIAAELNAWDQSEGDSFGSAVLLSGNTAFVGAPHAGDDGAVFVFEYREEQRNWVRGEKLEAPSENSTPGFGLSLAYERDVLVVGAEDAFHTFRRTDGGWESMGKTIASDGKFGDGFASSLALSQGTLVVGAPGWEGSQTDQGAAYVFEYNGPSWTERQRITLPQPATPSDRFGSAVAVDGDTILVGAPGFDSELPDDLDDGAAFVFRYAGERWGFEEALAIPSGLPISEKEKGRQFGLTVAVFGDRALVGHGGARTAETSLVAHIFERGASGWSEAITIPLPGTVADDAPQPVVLTRENLWVGSPGHEYYGVTPGAVFRCDIAEWGVKGCAAEANPGPEFEVVRESSRVDELTANLPLGVRMAASRQRLLVGANGAVNVYVSEGNRWLVEATLYEETEGAPRLRNVALHENRAVIATALWLRVYAQDTSGAWTFEDEIPVSPNALLAAAEVHLALHGDALAVSAGPVFEVYERDANGWKRADIEWLEDRSPAAGGAVGVSNSILLAAREGYDRVYVFHRRGGRWIQEGELTGGLGFGAQLAVAGDRAAVSEAGDVHVYRRKDGNWEQTDSLCSPEGGPEDFGRSLAMVGRRLVVGAPSAISEWVQGGAGYLFVRNGEQWILTKKLLSSDAQGLDAVGHFAGILDDRVVLHAPNHGVAGGRGELYEFELSPVGSGTLLGCSASSHGSSSGLGLLLMGLCWCLFRPLRNRSRNTGNVRSGAHKCANLSH